MTNIRDTIHSNTVSNEDKIKAFTKNITELEKLQREFAFMCAARAVEGCEVQEVKDYFTLILFIYESGELELLNSEEYSSAFSAAYWVIYRVADWAAYRAADSAASRAPYWAAYMAAYRAADWAADSAAEREVQVEMIKCLLERGE